MVEQLPVPDSHLQTESQINEVFKRGVLIPFQAQCKYGSVDSYWG